MNHRTSTSRVQTRARTHARNVNLSRWDTGTRAKHREIAASYADCWLSDFYRSQRDEYVEAFARELGRRVGS